MVLFYFRFLLDGIISILIAAFLSCGISYSMFPEQFSQTQNLIFYLSLPASNFSAIRSIVALFISVERVVVSDGCPVRCRLQKLLDPLIYWVFDRSGNSDPVPGQPLSKLGLGHRPSHIPTFFGGSHLNINIITEIWKMSGYTQPIVYFSSPKFLPRIPFFRRPISPFNTTIIINLFRKFL